MTETVSTIGFDSDLWHSASPNRSETGRRLLFALRGNYWMKRLDKFYRSPLPRWIAESDDPLVHQLWGIESSEPSVHGKDYTPILYS